mmetsp:Transcript_6098/g.20209  ORF Transcript_6098/g.20209 Transcript_6098/m.20209 type:complete len:306 (-) Transcript_6098:68-985(-)
MGVVVVTARHLILRARPASGGRRRLAADPPLGAKVVVHLVSVPLRRRLKQSEERRDRPHQPLPLPASLALALALPHHHLGARVAPLAEWRRHRAHHVALLGAVQPQHRRAVRADRAGAVEGVCEQLAAEERRAGLKEAVGAKAECEQVAASGHLLLPRRCSCGSHHLVVVALAAGRAPRLDPHLLERLEHLPVTLADGRLLIDMQVRPTEHALPKARDADCASEVLWLVGLPAGEEGVGGCDLCVGGLRRPRYDLLPPHLQLCCRLTQLQLQRALLPDRLLLEGGVAALEAVDRGEPPYEWTARG